LKKPYKSTRTTARVRKHMFLHVPPAPSQGDKRIDVDEHAPVAGLAMHDIVAVSTSLRAHDKWLAWHTTCSLSRPC
jgi:hypothetical protein